MMLSRLSSVSRQLVRPCAAVASQRCFSVSSPDQNKYSWYNQAWPAWQMYKAKAGESAGTMMGIGAATYLLSKEIFILNDEVLLLFLMGGTIYQICKAAGPSIGKMFDQQRDEILENLNRGRTVQIEQLEGEIMHFKAEQTSVVNRNEFYDVMRYNNEMELELQYRKRLQEVENEVKKRLDYQVDLQNLHQNIEQEHIAAWIEKEVVGAITKQSETDAIAQCLKDLDALSSKTK